ncbi:Nuclear transcription factor Y subunit A-3-like protein [Drosera capensis]
MFVLASSFIRSQRRTVEFFQFFLSLTQRGLAGVLYFANAIQGLEYQISKSNGSPFGIPQIPYSSIECTIQLFAQIELDLELNKKDLCPLQEFLKQTRDRKLSYPPFWNLDNERLSESLPKTFSLKLESPGQLSQKVRNLAFQLHDPNSSSSQSTQSNHDVAGQEDSCGRSSEQQMKPIFFMGPESALNLAQVDYGHSMPSLPYPRTDPYFGGLMSTYGSSPMIQPHMVGMTPARVPLPLINIGEEEPIYVNAKQYHGIIRRRESRAKLKAQNKLIKARKPYLHESRHRHALNRVRGSGGRFLMTKKLQQGVSDSSGGNTRSTPGSVFGQQQPQPQGSATVTAGVTSSSSSITYLTNSSSVTQQPPDRGPSSASASHVSGESVLGNGRWMNNPSNQHYAPVVW